MCVCQIYHCTLHISYNALFPLLVFYNFGFFLENAGIIDFFGSKCGYYAGIFTLIPVFVGQPAFMRVLWQHCISNVSNDLATQLVQYL